MTEPAPVPTPHAGVLARGLTKRFGERVALPPTDLDAPPGAVSVVGGVNGAGKTTLLRICATLVTPDAGWIRVAGLDPVRQGLAVRQQIGLALVNERSVFWRLTLRENLELAARVRPVPRAERRAHLESIAAALGLADLLDRRVGVLSAGQRQRAVLARAAVGTPPVLLVDEPLRGLDDAARDLVLTYLSARARAGATVVVATPTPDEAASITDRRSAVGDGEDDGNRGEDGEDERDRGAEGGAP